jgi:intracellular sulfur oxidation DsrE/DsrF family protein
VGLTLSTIAAGPSTVSANDKWLEGLTAKHRQFFDSPLPAGGIALVHIMNYYDTYNKAYGVADKDIDAVGTFYGGTTFYGVNDAMWAKYRIGEFLETNDPATGKAATINPWRTAPNIIGMTLPQASIERLQARGATFILCNNALSIFSGLLAKARGLDASVVYEDLKANILPGVYLVPGMVVAVEQAQRIGVAYHRQ